MKLDLNGRCYSIESAKDLMKVNDGKRSHTLR